MIKKIARFLKSKPMHIISIIAMDLFHIAASVYVLSFVVMGFMHLADFNGIPMDSKSTEMTALKIMVIPAMLYVMLRCFLRLRTFNLTMKERETDAQQPS